MSADEAANTQGESEGSPDAFPETKSASAEPLGHDNPYIFKHAPPKPDGDPWEILLKPALDADTMRCNAWKDEVSTLLIFAGLFSAVVTAFVIESYKFLQPGPNDAVVGLLFHIANSLNSTTPFPPAVDPASIAMPFSQTSTSVRINIVWFISLILSLTTVLVGTISLQWLREHQSYPDVSSKEKVAIFHMRSEALDVWYVPQVFSALPVLLQGALALFLGGLIDFVVLLGPTLTIPVCIIIGLTLLFLAATTVLPICQGFLFLTGFYPRSKPPTPCAFKSPQSRVLLSIFSPIIRILAFFIIRVYRRRGYYPSMFKFHRHTPLPYLEKALRQSTWPDLDRAWLRLRDVYHQCILDNDPDLYIHQRDWNPNCFPVSDVTQYLVKSVVETPTAKDTEAFLGATIPCFQEISASIWTDIPTTRGYKSTYVNLEENVRYNNFFEQLHGKPFYSIPKFIFRGGSYNIHKKKELPIILKTLNQDQMFYFLRLIRETHLSPQISQYQAELWSSIISEVQALPLRGVSPGSSFQLPSLLEDASFSSIYYGYSYVAQKFAASADMLSTVFKSAAGHHISLDQSLHSLCTHSHMAKVLYRLAYWTKDYLEWAQQNISNTSNQQHLQDIDAQYTFILKFVANHLNNSDLGQNSEEDTPSLLFYLASIFVWKLLDSSAARNTLRNKDSNFGQGFGSLLEALPRYKARTSGRKNVLLEKRFADKSFSFERKKFMDRFSAEWWDMLFEGNRRIALKAAEKGSAVKGGSSPNSRPSSSSQEEQKISDVITTLAAPSSHSIPLEVIHSSPISNELAPDGDIMLNPRSSSLRRASSNLNSHNEHMKRQSLFDSPAIANQATATNEALDDVANPTLPYSSSSSADLHANHPADGNHAANSATVRIPSPSSSSSPSPPPPSEEGGTGLPDVAANVFGDEQTRIHAGGPHLAIEFRSTTGSERNEDVEVADSGDGAPEGQARLEDAVVRIDSPK